MDMTNGIYFEDITPGQEFISPARTVTETDIVNFAGLSGDFNVIHTDAEFTKMTPFGQRIAHGLLGLSIASGLAARRPGGEQHRIIAFLGMTWDFRKPVFIDDTIHLEEVVAEKRETSNPAMGVVTYAVKVVNQRNEICQEGEWKVMYMTRPPDC